MLLCPLTMAAQQHKWKWHRVEVTSELDATPNEKALAVVKPYKASVDSVMAPVIGKSLVGMSAKRPESLLSNWAADVMVEFSDFHDGKRADMGLVNIGGLRNNMPEGTVRRGDIILISPFQNKLALLTLKGRDLMELFRNIAAVKGEGVSHEVALVVSKEGKLVSARLNGKKIKKKKIYRIATLDYLAEGNDKMFALKKAANLWVSDLYTRDCMMMSVERAGTINASLEGRITIR